MRPWNYGKKDDEEITDQLPAQLTQKDKVMLANTLVVFYGISMFVKDREDMTYYQIKSLYGEPDNDTGDVELHPANLSLLTQDQLRERVGIITLGDLDEGTLFIVISSSPYIIGEGENMRDEILARELRARKERQELYKEEDMILPKRFLPQLKGDRFPVIRRYLGKHNTKCGAKTYHDIQFMKPNDKRLQMSPLCIEYGTQLSSFDVL